MSILLVFLLVVAVVSFALWLGVYATTPVSGGPAQVTVLIPQASSFARITVLLADKNLIHDDIRFKLLAHLNHEGRRIRAGEFVLHGGQTPLKLLEELVAAQPVQHKFTIPEGYSCKDIAALLEAEGWVKSKRFISLCHDAAFIHGLKVGQVDSLEGFLYPDTYYITRIPRRNEEDIIVMMVHRFLQVWSELVSQQESVDLQKTLILASMVEKETAAGGERPLIAAVFRNRLRKGMRLQSDPTVIYGISSFDGNLTRNDLKTPSPYNTYTLPGLPAGPICNPGRASLVAVLQPADVNYLYFVSKNNGTHYFSTSLKEHNAAVNRYQRRKK